MSARSESTLDALWRRGRGSGEQGLAHLRRTAAAAILAPVQQYAEQWTGAMLAARNPLTAIEGPRRCGKTEGVGRWLLALLIMLDMFVVRMLTEVLSSPTDNWLEREGGANALTLIADNGLGEHCRVLRQAGSIKRISFSWSSALYVHDMANIRAIAKKRGFRAHVYWADEAQDMGLLPTVLSKLVLPTLLDFQGRVVCTGTPGAMVATLFHRAVQGLDGWSSHRLRPWDNPAFGDSVTERWSRICSTVIRLGRSNWQYTDEQFARMQALTPEQLLHVHEQELRDDLTWIADLHEDLQREMFGRWVRASSVYVFVWHKVPPEVLYWAQDAQSIEERFAALPKYERFGSPVAHSWSALIGMDFGFTSPCCWVVLLWSATCEQAFVLLSRGIEGLDDDQAFEQLVALCRDVERVGARLQLVIADLNGTRLGTHALWDKRLRERIPRNIPVQLAQKANKGQQIKAMNLDLKAGRLRVIEGDRLDLEGSNLQWRPDREDAPLERLIWKDRDVVLPNGQSVKPGDHCLDALRYCLPFCPVMSSIEPDDENEAQDEAARIAQQIRRKLLNA